MEGRLKMAQSRPRLASLILFSSLAASGCRYIPGAHATVHYEISANVRDGTRLYKGSGVWSFSVAYGGIDTPYQSEFHGDAIPIPLPKQKILLILPAVEYPHDTSSTLMLPELLFHQHNDTDDSVAAIRALSWRQGTTVKLDCYFENTAKIPSNPYGDCPQFATVEIGSGRPVYHTAETPLDQPQFDGLTIESITATITELPVTKQKIIEQLDPNVLSPYYRHILDHLNYDRKVIPVLRL